VHRETLAQPRISILGPLSRPNINGFSRALKTVSVFGDHPVALESVRDLSPKFRVNEHSECAHRGRSRGEIYGESLVEGRRGGNDADWR
jgi:hypothetical protein